MRFILLLAMMACDITLLAQDSTKYLVGLYFGGSYRSLDQSDLTGFAEIKRIEKFQQLRLQIGRKILDKWYMGVGLATNASHILVNPKDVIPTTFYVSDSLMVAPVFVHSDNRQRAYTPIVSVQYSTLIDRWLSLVVDSYLQYEMSSFKTDFIYYKGDLASSEYVPGPLMTGKYKYRTLGVGARMAIRLNVSNRFGLEWSLGGLSAKRKLNDTSGFRSSHLTEFSMSFRPADWWFGAYCKF